MDDLDALIRGLVVTFMEYYNYKCQTYAHTKALVFSDSDKNRILSNAYMHSEDLMDTLRNKAANLPSEGKNNRQESLACLLSIIDFLNQKLHFNKGPSWDEVRKSVITILVELYCLRELKSGKKRMVTFEDEVFELTSTAVSYEVSGLGFFNKIKTPPVAVAEFAKNLTKQLFTPLVGEEFQLHKSTNTRVSLIRSNIERLFEPYIEPVHQVANESSGEVLTASAKLCEKEAEVKKLQAEIAGLRGQVDGDSQDVAIVPRTNDNYFFSPTQANVRRLMLGTWDFVSPYLSRMNPWR